MHLYTNSIKVEFNISSEEMTHEINSPINSIGNAT
jgi:hypothetical protein